MLYALWQQRNFHLNTFEQRKAKRNGLKHVLGAAPGTYPPPCLYTVAACGICEMASASDINDVLSRLQNFDLDADADALDPGPIAHAFVCRWNEDGVRELFHRFANLYKARRDGIMLACTSNAVCRCTPRTTSWYCGPGRRPLCVAAPSGNAERLTHGAHRLTLMPSAS